MQAIGNPEELHDFARTLQSNTEGLRTIRATLTSAFSRLGETWRDRQHQQFAELFMQTMQQIDSFAQAADEFVPFLRTEAADLEQYHSRRVPGR